jgi:hypothetical protein
MGIYRYYFLTPADHIASVQEVEAQTDAEAVEEARALVAQHPSCTVEVWERSRLVRRHIWPSPRA